MAYRRILVAVGERRAEAAAVACRLATDRHAELTLVASVEVPSGLPLEAQMPEEDARGKEEIGEARAVAELYGVAATERLVHARSTGEAIVDAAVDTRAELVVVGAPRRLGNGRIFDSSVAYILSHAPCRVLVVAR